MKNLTPEARDRVDEIRSEMIERSLADYRIKEEAARHDFDTPEYLDAIARYRENAEANVVLFEELVRLGGLSATSW